MSQPDRVVVLSDGATPAVPYRIVRCTNQSLSSRCPRFGATVVVFGVPVGPFYEWPQLMCVCGAEPQMMQVGSCADVR